MYACKERSTRHDYSSVHCGEKRRKFQLWREVDYNKLNKWKYHIVETRIFVPCFRIGSHNCHRSSTFVNIPFKHSSALKLD